MDCALRLPPYDDRRATNAATASGWTALLSALGCCLDPIRVCGRGISLRSFTDAPGISRPAWRRGPDDLPRPDRLSSGGLRPRGRLEPPVRRARRTARRAGPPDRWMFARVPPQAARRHYGGARG